MASGSVSSIIIFVAAITVAAGVAGTLVTSVQEVSGAVDERSVDSKQTIDTEIEIISDPGSDALYDEGATEVTLLVKNTGGRTLAADADAVEVLMDGTYVQSSSTTVTVLDGSTWDPGTVVRITVDRDLDPGSHRAVVLINQDRELIRFNT